MCGRFFNHLQAMHAWTELLASWSELNCDWPSSGLQSYNIAPTQQVPIILSQPPSSTPSSIMPHTSTVQARWGMVPSWAKSFDSRYATHNARLESAAEKPVFRTAWRKQQRCIVPAGGYYEWQGEGKNKQAYVIFSPERPLLFAGIWELWQQTYSFTVLTQPASEHLQELHPRMPCMLSPASASAWLRREAIDLSDADDSSAARYYAVSAKVGNARNEGSELIEPEPMLSRGFDF